MGLKKVNNRCRGVINIERALSDDWKFQRFGLPTNNGEQAKKYFGAKLEEMGLVCDGAHLDVHTVDVGAKDETIRKYEVIPLVWPPNVKPEELKITLFIPVENG